jgi:hypothetical protein
MAQINAQVDIAKKLKEKNNELYRWKGLKLQWHRNDYKDSA